MVGGLNLCAAIQYKQYKQRCHEMEGFAWVRSPTITFLSNNTCTHRHDLFVRVGHVVSFILPSGARTKSCTPQGRATLLYHDTTVPTCDVHCTYSRYYCHSRRLRDWYTTVSTDSDAWYTRRFHFEWQQEQSYTITSVLPDS